VTRALNELSDARQIFQLAGTRLAAYKG
jgi:hypothetical protein